MEIKNSFLADAIASLADLGKKAAEPTFHEVNGRTFLVTGSDYTEVEPPELAKPGIMDFDSKPNSGTSAAAAHVLSSSGMKSLEHNGLKAFLVQFSSGHKAIVQRVPGETYTSAGASKRAQKWGAKSDMTRIEKLLSPSAPQMFGTPDTVDPALERASELLDKQMEKQIEKALE